jgi:hypothetical protein
MLTRPRPDPRIAATLAPPALSNDVRMTPASENNGRPSGSEGAQGVLANLPRTRPQRSTARRSAARRETAAAQPADTSEAPKARATAKSRSAGSARGASASGRARKARATSAATAPKPAKRATAAATKSAKGAASPKPRAKASTGTRTAPTPRRPAPSAAEGHVPLQGFESEMDRASGPVQPPGGTELVASAAELIGELARAGFSTGERLLRDAFARLPLS